MKHFVALLLVGLVAACANQNTGPSPANIVYAAKQTFVGAQTLAIQYVSLPRCGQPSSPPLCSDQGVVDAIKKGNNDAVIALDAAEKTVRDPNASGSVVNAAVVGAQNAVAAFTAIVNANKKG